MRPCSGTAASTRCGDCTPSAPTLIDQLTPYSGQLLVTFGNLNIWGAADRYLGMMETLTSDFDAADLHFRHAVVLEESAGGLALAARARYWHARMLSLRDETDDLDRARVLLADCVETATRLGMAALQLQAHQLASSLRT